jgi:hypothetical protein
MTRLALTLLVVIMAATLPGRLRFAVADIVLVPVHSKAPVDGAVILANGSPIEVTLAWNAPRQRVPVRFFVEVVTIDGGALREVFASYVDQPTVTLTLDGKKAEYAWRVYTIGRTVAQYALSRWERFSVRSR